MVFCKCSYGMHHFYGLQLSNMMALKVIFFRLPLWNPSFVHPSGVLRNLLIVPRAFDFLSKHKKLMGAKGLWTFLKASWRLMHTGTCSDSGLGFLTAPRGIWVDLDGQSQGKGKGAQRCAGPLQIISKRKVAQRCAGPLQIISSWDSRKCLQKQISSCAGVRNHDVRASSWFPSTVSMPQTTRVACQPRLFNFFTEDG